LSGLPHVRGVQEHLAYQVVRAADVQASGKRRSARRRRLSALTPRSSRALQRRHSLEMRSRIVFWATSRPRSARSNAKLRRSPVDRYERAGNVTFRPCRTPLPDAEPINLSPAAAAPAE